MDNVTKLNHNSDLKSFYPSKKSLHSPPSIKPMLDVPCLAEESSSNKLSNSVVTIDLSDDSLIESSDLNEINNNKCEGQRLSISSDDSVNTLVPSPAKEPLKPAIKKIYTFSDSDDDSFLDIPLSQRIGLGDKVTCDSNKDSSPNLVSQDENSRKVELNWLDDEDSIEAWTLTKDNNDTKSSDAEKSSPIKSRQSSLDKDVSPFKQPKITKKIEKRPYQSETPPHISYTSLKEKNLKNDPPSTSGLSDEEAYKIDDTITPARKRRTPEEIKKLKEEKERRKAEKAEEKKAKEKMKMKEKEKKAALREAGRTKLLTDCHKFCKTFVDIALLEKFKISDELQAIFKEKEAPLILDTNNPVDCGIRWVREQREMIEEGEDDTSVVNLIRKDVEADVIFKVLHATEFIPLVNVSVSKIELESSDDESDKESCNQTLFEFVTSLLDAYDKNLTLIFYGYEKYWNQQKNRENQEYRAKMGMAKKRVTKNKDTLPLIKKSELDLAIFDLQVKLNESSYSTKHVHIIQSETPVDLCNIIWAHTRSTAMYVIKKSQREQQGLEWYAQNDGFGSVDIVEDSDITSLWIKQLMSFTKMSLEMAKAVSEVYPCLQSLLSAYKLCTNQEERENLLGSIEVSRKNLMTGTTSKKLGPQASRRIYQYFTTRDGEAIIE